MDRFAETVDSPAKDVVVLPVETEDCVVCAFKTGHSKHSKQANVLAGTKSLPT